MANHNTQRVPGKAVKTWVKELRLSQLRLDGGTQQRVRIDQEVAANYARLLLKNTRFPPVEVVFDGTHYWLWNGFHRYEAHTLAGRPRLYAEIRQGTLREAIFLSLGANKTNGIRPSPDDKKRAVFTMLRDPEWCHLPNTQIAEHCDVDEGTVRNRREDLLEELLAARKGQGLTNSEVHQKTGSSLHLIDKVRARLKPPVGSDSEIPSAPPAESQNGESLEDILDGLTPHQRAVYDGLPAEDQEAFLALARDEARESEVDALERQQNGQFAGRGGARGGARLTDPDVLGREDQVELLVRQLRQLLERRDACTKALKALEDFLGVCRAEFAELAKKKQERTG